MSPNLAWHEVLRYQPGSPGMDVSTFNFNIGRAERGILSLVNIDILLKPLHTELS
jgi:hypothetical protein